MSKWVYTRILECLNTETGESFIEIPSLGKGQDGKGRVIMSGDPKNPKVANFKDSTEVLYFLLNSFGAKGWELVGFF